MMESDGKKGVVDRHHFTLMFDVVSKSGSVNEAIAPHAEDFCMKNIVSTLYCDRILLQMLIKNRRIKLYFSKCVDRAAYTQESNVYTWHKGAAFHAGNISGNTGAGNRKLVYTLGNK